MKKLYTNPDMDIKVFEKENIVTASGQSAVDRLKASYENDTSINGGYKAIKATDMMDFAF